MDKVFIEGLEIEALIGIYDWERRIRQTLRFDLEMGFDNRKPAASDAIADTLDYKAVSKRLIEYVGQSEFGLSRDPYRALCGDHPRRVRRAMAAAQAEQAGRGARCAGGRRGDRAHGPGRQPGPPLTPAPGAGMLQCTNRRGDAGHRQVQRRYGLGKVPDPVV